MSAIAFIAFLVICYFFITICKRKRVIIGVAGGRGQGKDTVAKIIYGEGNGIHVLRFADGLRDAFHTLTGITKEESQTDLCKSKSLKEYNIKGKPKEKMEIILEKYWFKHGVPQSVLDSCMEVFMSGELNWSKWPDITVGRALQLLGTEIFRMHCHEDILVKELERVWITMGRPDIVIPDTRLPNEREWIKKNGGKIIKVKRNLGEIKDGRSNDHLSERGFKDSEVDYVIDNNKGITDLRNNLNPVFHDLLY